MATEGANGLLRPIARLLVDVLGGGEVDPELVRAVLADGPAPLFEAAILHRVSPAVYRALRADSELRAAWLEPFALARHQQLRRHLMALAELRRVAEALNGAGVRWCVLKGPALACWAWPAVDMREYGDLDILIDPADIENGLAALAAAGCPLTDRNWPLLRQTMRAEVAVRTPSGLALDVHWHLVVDADKRRRFPLRIGPVLERLERRELAPGLTVPTLDPVDFAHHVTLHAAHSGAGKLVWLADVGFSVAAPGFDPGTLALRAAEAHTSLAVALVCDRVARVVQPSAGEVVAYSGESRRMLLAVARRRDLRYPPPGLPGDRHLGGALYSGASRGTVSSVMSAAADSMKIRRISRKVARDEALGRETDRVLERDVPDREARREYFRAAAGTP